MGWAGLRSAAMIDGIGEDRDLSVLVVPAAGAVEVGSGPWAPVRLIDRGGEPVVAVMAFLRELQASGRSAATQRSYAMDLLRWFRFGWAIDVGWDRATRVEARDFCRWLALRDKPVRAGAGRGRVVPNAVTGKPGPGPKYAASTRAHSETVLRVLRLSPRRWDGPDGQPVPAVPGTAWWPGACPSQPDGGLPQRAG